MKLRLRPFSPLVFHVHAIANVKERGKRPSSTNQLNNNVAATAAAAASEMILLTCTTAIPKNLLYLYVQARGVVFQTCMSLWQL